MTTTVSFTTNTNGFYNRVHDILSALPEGVDLNVFTMEKLKRPRTAYQFFCMENKENIKESDDMKYRSLGKALGRAWREIKDTEEADKYYEQEEKERYNYNKGIPVYRKSHCVIPNENGFEESKGDEESKDQEHQEHQEQQELKRPRTAYNFFCMENEESLALRPDMEYRSLGRELGRMWRSLDQNERKRYDKLAKEDARKFNAED